MKLIDIRAADGSRVFAQLPAALQADVLLQRARSLTGMEVINDVSTQGWFDFRYDGFRFLVHADGDCWLLSVSDPRCNDVRLFDVARKLAGNGDG